MVVERFDANSFTPIWVRHEHLARHQFAAAYVTGKVVVDCACGDGTGAVTFAQAGAAMVYALDISQESIARMAKKYGGDRLKFIPGDATNLPLPDGAADVYVSLETIEHLDRDVDYLREAARVVKPDGVFVCSTPNRLVCNPGKTINSKPFNPFHVREYSQQEFCGLLGQFFKEVELFGQNPKQQSVVRLMEGIGRVLPAHGAARLNQALKLPRFLYDRFSFHQVMSADTWKTFEYFVAVCRQPLSAPLSGER